MIQVTMYEEKWRIKIIDETFEVDSRLNLDGVLKTILNLKESYGKIKKKEVVVGCSESTSFVEDEEYVTSGEKHG